MLSKRLKEILNEKKITLEYYSQMSGVPMETLRNIYYGRTSNPNIKTVMAMAEALDMTINSFLGVENSVNKEELQLIQDYRRCSRQGRNRILFLAAHEVKREIALKEEINKKSIPCFSGFDDCFYNGLGDPGSIIDIYTGKKEAYMAFQTNSNEYAPTYYKGDILLLENRFPRSGEQGVFYYREKILIRIFIEEKNGYELKCLHRIGENIILRRLEGIECLGTCCGVIPL